MANYEVVTANNLYSKKKNNQKIWFIAIVIIIIISAILDVTIAPADYIPGTYLSINLIVAGIIRITISVYFAIIIMRLFIKQERHYITDAKHLYAWQFILITIGKIADIILINIAKGDIKNLENDLNYLLPLKIRWIIIIMTIAPTFFFFIRIYSKTWAMKISESRKIKYISNSTANAIDLKHKIEIWIERIIDISFIVFAVLLTIIASNYKTLKVLLPLIMVPTIIFGIITFRGLYKHKRLPEFNSLMMICFYILYFISQIMRAIYASPTAIIFFEMMDSIFWFIAGCAFLIPPKYGTD
ncbi:MAG: hypothetical protein ACTSRZ_04340 [Promethearchaeota archaeon]